MIEKDRKMYPVFVDLEKAYDKVCREELCMGMLTEIWCVRSSTESHKGNASGECGVCEGRWSDIRLD